MTDVSFAVASFNSAAFLKAAVRSALAQRGVDVEVLIVDDGSTDASFVLAERLAAADPRVRVFRTPANLGPGGARNIARDHARGDWLAVLDSDDLVHPDRSARLIAEAKTTGADMIADDLMVFDDAGSGTELFLRPDMANIPAWLPIEIYFRDTVMFGRRPNLGFLKPMIRTEFLRRHAIRYDESLRIAEDDDLVVRLLLAGARYRLLPEPLYFYRKHGTSISHRLSIDHADRMVAAAERLQLAIGDRARGQPTYRRRHRAILRARAFTQVIDALKRRAPRRALSLLACNPGMWPLLRMPLAGALRRLLARRRAAAAPRAGTPTCASSSVLFISKQRLVGTTNGSSAYLLSLAEAVREAGMTPHLLQPSPTLFGRMPVLRLRPEMGVFATHRVRGGVRIDRFIVATGPTVWRNAAAGIAARLMRKIGIKGPLSRDRKAPYAIATPWLRDDLRFVALHGRRLADVVIADYMFQTEAFPYMLDPQARTAVVMHDLFHARADQFDADRGADSVAALDVNTEIALLGRADTLIAIQSAEAEFVRERVTGSEVVLVPMTARPVPAAQPGEASRLLFVGSDTAPNVHGLRWFLGEVWPLIRDAVPHARVEVAGRVAQAFDGAPTPGVRMLGLVDDLAGCYAEAGIVISPLLQGSGLKIKLVEALAFGKACVVTSVTLQGVEAMVGNAVCLADTADAFAAAVIGLAVDDRARRDLAERALAVATTHFGPAACHAEFDAWLRVSAEASNR